METQDWMSMKEAAKVLKVSYYKLSQLAMTGEIETKPSLRDKRMKMVSIKQIKEVLDIK
jgi:hypothetical protein